MEIYDPVTKEWKMGEAMSMLRSRVGVAVMEGKLYAFGGFNGTERFVSYIFEFEFLRFTCSHELGYRLLRCMILCRKSGVKVKMFPQLSQW